MSVSALSCIHAKGQKGIRKKSKDEKLKFSKLFQPVGCKCRRITGKNAL